jgi:two-component system LytT family response regulator
MEPIQKGSDESPPEKQPREALDVAFRSIAQEDAAELIKITQQREALATGQSPRIAFKAKGRIFLMHLAEIVAVQAEGDYVSLQHGLHSYLLRGSLSAIGETLKPYGFIRIHRSVVVNASLVEEIEPLSTGEYKLRVKGGQEYMVTRTYRGNLRFVAHLWLGPNIFAADPSCK